MGGEGKSGESCSGAFSRCAAGTVLILLGLFVWGALPASAYGAGCPNEAFRAGPSAALPDCRAYELVTPPDSNGRLVGPIITQGTPPIWGRFPTELASPSRASIVYMSYASPLLEIPEATGTLDVYEAVRTNGGWETSRRFNPPGSKATGPIPGGIASDHLYASTNVGGTLSSMALGGSTDYLVNPDGTFELVGVGSLGTEPFAQTGWISSGGEHVIFATGFSQSIWCGGNPNCKVQQLEPDAAPTGTGAIYDRAADGPTHVVSLLPGDVPAGVGEEAFFKGASRDASSIAFTINGVLYVRVNNVETQRVAEGNPTFAGLSDDGRYLFYVAGGNIHRFDTTTEDDEQLNATGDAKVVIVSGDGSHAYFISNSQIGGEGVAGQPNIYAWGAGATKFVATVLPVEAESIPGLTAWTTVVWDGQAAEHGLGASTARTTPDGRVLVFESRAQLTSYDNGGHLEIYRYETGQGLTCVSCSPAGEPATDDAHLQQPQVTGTATVINNLSEDGKRVFFETKEALISADQSPANDIYEWQEGEGGTTELSLISSGRSVDYPAENVFDQPYQPNPNVLLSVTPDASDVVFLSQDALVPGAGEGGTTGIYDARVGGGFPPAEEASPCVEENCHPGSGSGAASPQGAPSEATVGDGNVKPRKHRRRCRHARKHRKHRHCAKHKASKRRFRSASASTSSSSETERDSSSSGGAAQVPGPAGQLGSTSDSANASNSTTAAAPVLTRSPEFDEFGFESVGAALSTPRAGLHPDFTTELTFNHRIEGKTGDPQMDARTEEISVHLPPGLIGNPRSLPTCNMGVLVSGYNCSPDSQVGVAEAHTLLFDSFQPVFNLEPPHPDREVARLGFYATSFTVFIDVKVRTASDYGVTATVHSANALDALVSAKTTLWGNPADPSHDEQRLTIAEAAKCSSIATCKVPPPGRPSGLPPAERKAFMTNPSSCQAGELDFEAKSYQLPGQVVRAAAPLPSTVDCTGLPFAPSFDANPTSRAAGAPTGLRTKLVLPQHLGENERATATMREARVTFPAGMQIAAGAANWIGTCSEQQVGFHEEVDAACPDAAKLGTATIASPAIRRPLQGELFQRTPTPSHQFGLWLVSDDLGLHVKLPAEIEPDPNTGRLSVVFHDLPQVPLEEVELNVWGGPRAPLENPDACGTYATDYTFTPHSNDAAVSGQSQMTIDEGCNQGFSPTLRAGVKDPVAGRFSPLVFDLAQDDGQQALRGFELHLPKGELAKLAGVPLCSDPAATSGSCPDSSKIGALSAVAGPGPEPLRVPQPGKAQPAIYLAGPYEGAPFSIVSEVPAQAGPFDLGLVVVRSALEVDPETAQVTADADPLPQFFEGVGLTYRHLHAVIDRPNFALNPTNCRELAVTSEVTSTQGVVAHPATRFQVDGCKALSFKPGLLLKLRGGTERADYPALTAVFRARKGDANTASVSVALPHSEFLAQEHIGTICTRKRFAADKCPKRSVYGKAKAWTPLLDKPLEGPVYLRSSDHPLPDLVAALRGELEIDLVGRIDSKNGGIRTTFEKVPDARVSKFVLRMKGGGKGLLTNSQNICQGTHRATVQIRAHNGRAAGLRPQLMTMNCGRGPSKK